MYSPHRKTGQPKNNMTYSMNNIMLLREVGHQLDIPVEFLGFITASRASGASVSGHISQFVLALKYIVMCS